jgi:C1A family cysteine protease
LRLQDQSERVARNNDLYEASASSFKQSLYEFSYLPQEEFIRKYTGLVNSESTPIIPRQSRAISSKCANLPAEKNWATEGKTSPTQNQAGCGASYLLSAIAALEAASAIAFNTTTTKLSAQHTLECVKNMTGGEFQGCSGGNSEIVWRYAKESGGLVAESSYKPFSGNDQGACASNLTRDNRSEVDYWSLLPSDDEEALKCHVAPLFEAVKFLKIQRSSS